MLIHHWWFTGRTRRVNISLIRFSWQARLVYSAIYHIHLRHNITRHNKQSQPSFDYFRVEEKYISHCLEQKREAFGGDCSVSSAGLKGPPLNERVIKCADTHRGPAVCTPSLAGLLFGHAKRLLPSKRLIKIFAPLSLAENEKLRMCNQQAAKAKPNYVKV